MKTMRSPSNRITVEVTGTKPLDDNDSKWLSHIQRLLAKHLAYIWNSGRKPAVSRGN